MEKTGQNFGEYEVMEEVGRGAMGVVYRAVDRRIGREVALKIVKMTELGEGQPRAQLQERLRREARAAGILSHPRIVTIYGLVELEDQNYIVMEFVNGPTLTQLLTDLGNIPPQRVGDLILQAAQGLDYAHKRGVVHRDIKPANLMIDDLGEVKITDFGVAKIFKDQSMTQAGMLMGTPYYMAPEQIMGVPLTGAADQFALAVIAYELLAGHRPFDAENLPSLIHQILNQPPKADQPLTQQFGPGVAAVLDKALAKKSEDRYPTCCDFATALSDAIAGRTPKAPSTSVVPEIGERGTGTDNAVRAVSLSLFNWKLTVSLSAAVAVLGAGLAYHFTRDAAHDRNDGKKNDVVVVKPPVDNPQKQPDQNVVKPPIEKTVKQDEKGTRKGTVKEVQVAIAKPPIQNGKPPVETIQQKPPDQVVVPPPVVPPVNDTQPEPTGEYGSRKSGEITWSGNLAPGEVLRIRLDRVQKGGGSLSGPVLRGLKPVDVTQVTPDAANLIEKPSEANRYSTLAVKNTGDEPLSVVRFQWRLR